MSVDAKTLLRITQIDMPPEALRQVLQVLADVQFAEDERKAKDRDRKRAGRVTGKSSENPRKIQGISNGKDTECPPDTPVSSAPQRDIIKPPASSDPGSSLRSEARVAFRSSFDRWWDLYPNKVGKPVAERHYAKLWREFDGRMEPLFDGLEFYVRTKPADRPWLNPATFLNQRRFEDQPGAQPRAGPRQPFVDGRQQVSNQLDEIIRESGQHHPGTNGREARPPNSGSTSLFDDSDERHRAVAGGQVLRLAGTSPYGRR